VYLKSPFRATAFAAAESNDPVVHEITCHLAAHGSGQDDLLNFFRNYKSVEALLAGRPWLFSLIEPSDADPIAEHLDPAHQAGPHRTVDKARDASHPGPQCHDLICQAFWDKFVAGGGVEKMRLRANGAVPQSGTASSL
jgi:hypothetical protein